MCSIMYYTLPMLDARFEVTKVDCHVRLQCVRTSKAQDPGKGPLLPRSTEYCFGGHKNFTDT